MKIPKIAIQNYQFTIVMFIMVTLFGIISYFTMPKTEDPVTEWNVTTVLVINPGSSPEDMETLIADPLEEAFNEIEGIEKMTSEISDGLFFSFVEYEYGQDYDKKHQEVLQKINEKRIELPETIIRLDAFQPSVLDVCIYQIGITSEGATSAELKKEADKLKKIIEKTHGVRAVNIDAEQELEVRITCDMERLAAYNISLGRIISIVQSENLSIPGGSINLGNKEFNVLTSGLYRDLDDIKNTVINTGPSGILRLKDVAHVDFDYAKPEVFARLPKLMERAGTKKGVGTITGIYTVLVEGDDMDEPIADSVRAISDGHIILSRELASKNQFPAIDVLQSLSRVMNKVSTSEHRVVASHLRNLMSAYRNNEDLINVGAYVQGSNPTVDKALVIYDDIVALLKQEQGMSEFLKTEELYDQMVELARKAELTVNPTSIED